MDKIDPFDEVPTCYLCGFPEFRHKSEGFKACHLFVPVDWISDFCTIPGTICPTSILS